MPITLQGQVAPQTLSDGFPASIRLGRSGEVVIQELHGVYYEQAKRGNLFTASVGVAGVAPGTVVGTAAAFSLYNPAGSGKDIVLLISNLAYLSGTLGAGALFYCQNAIGTVAPTGGTACPTLASNGGAAAGVGVALSGSTLPVAPKVIGTMGSLTAMLASTAVQPYALKDEIKGLIIVQPGGIFSIQAVAVAGTVPLVILGLAWEEVAI